MFYIRSRLPLLDSGSFKSPLKRCNAMCESFLMLSDHEGLWSHSYHPRNQRRNYYLPIFPTAAAIWLLHLKDLTQWLLRDIPFFLRSGSDVHRHAELIDALIGIADERDLGSPFAEQV